MQEVFQIKCLRFNSDVFIFQSAVATALVQTMRPVQRPQASLRRALHVETQVRGTRQVQVSGRDAQQLQLRHFPGKQH